MLHFLDKLCPTPRAASLAWPVQCSRRVGLLAGVLLVLVVVPVSILQATSLPDEDTSWRIDATNVRLVRGSLQEGESQLRSHTADTSYRVSFECLSGNELLAITPIRPSYLIREVDPSIQVFCQQTGVQLMARVVLPLTESPTGEGALSFWIPGDRCQQSMRWTPLRFGSQGQGTLYEKFRAQLPILRRKYGAHVNEQKAYIDALALNLCGGKGQQEVFLDSLRVGAQVLVNPSDLPDGAAKVAQVGYQDALDLRPSRVVLDHSVIMEDGRPMEIRAVEYNGEAMTTLKELGFNTLWMASPPTLAQLERAKDHDLKLIAPAPVEDGVTPIGPAYDVVLAWLVGDQVHWSDQQVVRKRIDLVHQVDRREGRPTIVRARTGLADYSRAADMLCVGKRVVGTSFPMQHYSDFLQQRSSLTQKLAIPLIAEVDTEVPDEILTQVEALSGVRPPLTVQPEQLRGMCFQAIAGGARGFLFRSRNRLDDSSIESRQRRLAIRWVNQQVDQLRPWIAAGAVMSQEPQANPNVRVYVLQTSLSRLLLIHQLTGLESYSAGWSSGEILNVSFSGAGVSRQPYRVTPTGLVPATHTPRGHQLELQLENAGDWEVVVLTEDQLVRTYVDQYSPGNDHTVLTLDQADLTAEWLSRLGRAMIQANRDRPDTRTSVDRILSLRNSLIPLATSDDPLAYWNQYLMLQREAALARLRLVVETQQSQSWPTASPLTVHPFLAPLHWQSVTRLNQLEWSANGLPGGDFEDLDHTIRSGWRHRTSGGNRIASDAELSEDAVVEGRRGLLLKAANASNVPLMAMEHTPIWIDSASIPIPANHLVRISGNVRIDQPITASLDGVTIRDSLGGEPLQQRLYVTQGWQPFVVYRATLAPHDLQLTLALNGLGSVRFDEIQVQIAPLPTGPGAMRPELNLPDNALPPLDTRPGLPAATASRPQSEIDR